MQLLSDYIDIEKEFNNIFVLDKRLERYKLMKDSMAIEINSIKNELEKLENKDGINAEMETFEASASLNTLQDGVKCLNSLIKQTEEAQTSAKVRYLSETMEKIHFKALETLKEDMKKASFFDEYPNEISLEQAYKEMGWK
jgi:CII-binding regulator of phage lambda lysogenization HflD